jgi:cytochrome oxidase Cu insertion factor (SCO1/SenC/PrrC family)
MNLKRGWTVLAAGAALLLGSSGGGRAQAPELLKPGDAAPNFTLKTPDGQEVSLSELTKKNIVLVNFFFNG